VQVWIDNQWIECTLDQLIEWERKELLAMDACGPWEYTIDQTVSKPAPKVSQCCKAPVFSEGDRWVCGACRLGTKPIAENEATG
jgi:hypothetical protein